MTDKRLVREKFNGDHPEVKATGLFIAGLASARARGRKGGRPKQLDEGQVRVVIALANAGELTIQEICKQVGCSRSTYYRQVSPGLQATAEAEPLQLDQSVYVAPGVIAIVKPKPKLSYVCKKQAGKGGIVHAVKGKIRPCIEFEKFWSLSLKAFQGKAFRLEYLYSV